jgi:SOS-response transcriptional repressor LexA
MSLHIERVLNSAIQRAGTERGLAKVLGCSHSAVGSWRTGTIPNTNMFLKMLDFINADISRALPEYSPGVEAARIPVVGRVSAGLVNLAVEESGRFESADTIWKKSVYRSLTTGSTVLLEVAGNSMEPEFIDGSYVVAARPATSSLPDLCPVIARVGEEATLKLWRKSKNPYGKTEIELVPLNRTYDIQRYRPEEVVIDYIALGSVTPWQQGYQKQSPKPVLMRDGK